MIVAELWKPRRAKRARVHQMRTRRACFGELVQIDGSPYDWFEGRAPACSLLVFIDDATGCLLELYFTPQESFFSYSAAMRRYFARLGKPLAFYSDKHGIFRVNAKNAVSGTGLTQFGRALQELDIQSVCANTPQAKGRVERTNKTLPDRLVKEMRLQGISTLAAGNEFVIQFMDDFNRRFAVVPADPRDAHRPLRHTDDRVAYCRVQRDKCLDVIFTRQDTRTLSKNLALQYNKVVYQIQTARPGYALRNARVTLYEQPDGEIAIRYKGRLLEHTVFKRQQRQAEVVSSKSLNNKLRKPTRPAADHPWRTYPAAAGRGGRSPNGKPTTQTAQNG